MISKTTIKRKKEVMPKNPILIVGLPGIGNVGKLVAEHLRREFGAKKFATMYSPHFPHQVIMLKNGAVRLVNNRFYLITSKGRKNDIVILTGDVQAVSPEGQYETNAAIVDFFKNALGGKFVYTIGGYSIGEPITGKPRVFGNATDKKIKEQFKDTDVIFGKSKGMIWGSAGLIIAFAKMQGIEGICLMGETSMLDVDASAAKAVTIQLAKKLGLKIDTAKLDEIIKKTASALKELERQAAILNAGQQPQPFLPAGTPESKESAQRPSYIR